MSNSMTILLRDSIGRINNLYDYYIAQEISVSRYVRKNIKRYKYGMILDQFFAHQLSSNEDIALSEKEKEIISEMLDDFNVIDSDGNGSVRIKYKLKESFSIDGNYELDPIKAREGFTSLIQQSEILHESVLMMLLVMYEDAISSIYQYLIDRYPHAFLSDKCITYSELMNMNSNNIEEIKQRFIDKEIDAIMREPISNWYDSFKKRQKASFLFAENLFDEFKEIYYRRNIVVHNQGIVNEIYLSNIKSANVKVGERLRVDRCYLEKAFSITVRVLVDTFFGLRKMSNDIDELYTWISNYGYECLVEKKWEQAKYIFQVLLQDEKMKHINRCISQINYWIAIKNMDGVSAIQKEVSSLDVSAMQLQFSVAKEALLNNHQEVSKLLDICLESGEIPANYIQTWPLLNEYRASDEYSGFIEKHKMEMEIGEYEPSTETESFLSVDSESDEGGMCEPGGDGT